MANKLTKDWIETLENNLKLLEEEKKTKLKGIILNMREELRNVWDKLYYSQVIDFDRLWHHSGLYDVIDAYMMS